MKIRPLQDRILVQRIEEEETTKGGIIIPDSAKEKPQEGKVIAVGNGKVLVWDEVAGGWCGGAAGTLYRNAVHKKTANRSIRL